MESWKGIVAALAIAFAMSATAAPVITGTSSGTSDRLTLLTATITVDGADVGKTGNLYVVAVAPQPLAVAALGANGWAGYTSGVIPSPRSGVVLGTHTVPIVSGPAADVSSLAGARVFAGYGVDQDDMLNGNKFALIYQICPSGRAWQSGVDACVLPVGGVKTSSFHQLPVGCTLWTQQCAKDARPNMVVVATGAKTGSGDDIVLYLFRNASVAGSVTGLWNVFPVNAKTGTPVVSPDITGGYSLELDGVWGSARGYIFHQKGVAATTCFDMDALRDAGAAVACPTN